MPTLARRIRWRRVTALTTVAAVICAGTALAASDWTYIVNFNHAATIDESGQPGNFQIWGLGYAKLIVGGRGNNVLVGDGRCLIGSGPSRTNQTNQSNQSSSPDNYCDDAPIRGSGADHVIKGGGGANWIYSGYGPDEQLYGGQGPNFILSAPTSSTIYGGPSGDTIDASHGSTTVHAGQGRNVIVALSRQIDHVYCSGRRDTVFAYRYDVIVNCAHVIYERPFAADRP
jgi:hypothetical protein